MTAVMTDNDFATLLDRRLKRIEEMKANAIEATPVMVRRSMLNCRLDCLIGASGGFDHYRTGRDLAIPGPTTGSQTQGEASVDRAKHRLWGGCRCLTREDCLIFFGLATGVSAHHLPVV